jgi:ribosomal protein S18 acetylase RimI-like enzyme
VAVEVGVAVTAEELDSARGLMRAFIAWHRARHVDDRELIDRYFDDAAFERELASLPAPYSPLLLARVGGEPAGCVGLRRLDGDACEMKRMYVDERFRGSGVGRALTQRLLADARAQGFRRIRLDTSVRQTEAQGLYGRYGFRPIAPYYELPEDLREWLVFMELEL